MSNFKPRLKHIPKGQLKVEKNYKYKPNTGGGGKPKSTIVYVFDKDKKLIEPLPADKVVEKYNISRSTLNKMMSKEKLFNDHYFAKTDFLCLIN